MQDSDRPTPPQQPSPEDVRRERSMAVVLFLSMIPYLIGVFCERLAK